MTKFAVSCEFGQIYKKIPNGKLYQNYQNLYAQVVSRDAQRLKTWDLKKSENLMKNSEMLEIKQNIQIYARKYRKKALEFSIQKPIYLDFVNLSKMVPSLMLESLEYKYK